MTAPAPTKRRGGRPRDPSRDDVILDAAVQMLAEEGLASTTMDAVAARAGTGKATIYRRWPSRSHVLAAAITSRTPVVEWPEVPRHPLTADIVAVLTAFTTGDRSRAALALLSELSYDPVLRAAHAAGPAAALDQALVVLVDRSASRGLLLGVPFTERIRREVTVRQHSLLTAASYRPAIWVLVADQMIADFGLGPEA